MVSFFSLAALALLPATMAQNLMVNTPVNVVQCQPIQFSWVGGTSPYFLSLIPAGQPSAPAVKQFPTQSGSTFTWNVDLPAGTSLTISLKDSSGVPAFSDKFTVENGTDTSCLNTAITDSGSGGAAAPTSGGSPAGSSTVASTTGSSGSVRTGASATSSGASASNTTKPNSASTSRGNALVVAGVMGLIGAALF